jgi:hypothetical protein
MQLNTQNPMFPLSKNDRTEETLAQDGVFMITVVLQLLVESAFWGKFGIPIVAACC